MGLDLAPRLPGIAFQTVPPPRAEALPRMDIAAFVGFAASGPIHMPVPIEDPSRFVEIFGEDLALAWDDERGRWTYAHLGGVVRSFFSNGGRRCWVVRVARTSEASSPSDPGAAATDRFLVPGLWRPGDDGSWVPVSMVARSAGSWADDLELGAGVVRSPLAAREIVRLEGGTGSDLCFRLRLDLRPARRLQPGDLIRASFEESERALWCVVTAYGEAEEAGGTEEGPVVDVVAWCWTEAVSAEALGWQENDAVRWRSANGASAPFSVIAATAGSPPEDEWLVELWASGVDPSDVRPGEPWRIDAAEGAILFTVEETLGPLETDAASANARVRGHAFRVIPAASDAGIEKNVGAAESLSLELQVGSEGRVVRRLPDLGCENRHPRFAGALPTDADLYFEDAAAPDLATEIQGDGASHDWRRRDRQDPVRSPSRVYEDLWREVDHPRFPLAGDGPGDAVYLPVGLLPGSLPALPSSNDGREPLSRDGLELFSRDLFVDEDLTEVGWERLLAEADRLRYGTTGGRPLRGIHSLLSVEEATILAVPDAAHPGWDRGAEPQLPDPRPGDLVDHPEWAPCRDPAAPEARSAAPDRSRFLPCDVRVVEPPSWEDASIEDDGTLVLAWSHPEDGVVFVLEQSVTGTFADARMLYVGSDRTFGVRAAAGGAAWYRVRAVAAGQSSHWSEHRAFSALSEARFVVRSTGVDSGGSSADAEDLDLLSLHRRILTMCAARGDLFGVLSLPAGLREDDAIHHAEDLGVVRPGGTPAVWSSALQLLSYGALYHPWVVAGSASAAEAPRVCPPDGVACGLLAARARARGAWVAPANLPLKGVVSLEPALSNARRLDLYETQVNALWKEPRGFMAMSDWTLSSDPDLRTIGVRRLLQLLRRLALSLGRRWVFEPNGPVLRRAVQRGLEAALEVLYQGGAFAGDSRGSSFQVVVDDTVNPAEAVEQGRFVAEIRVAPSLPMRFITVRLVQTGADGLVVTEG